MFWIVKFSVISEVLSQNTFWVTRVFKIDPEQRISLQLNIQWVPLSLSPSGFGNNQVGYPSQKDFYPPPKKTISRTGWINYLMTHNKKSNTYCSLFFWPCHMACRILLPQPGIKPMPPIVEAGVLSTGPSQNSQILSTLKGPDVE